MNNPVFMNVLNSWENLLHEVKSFLLIKTFVFDDEVEKLASFGVLHDKMDIAFGLDNMDKILHTS